MFLYKLEQLLLTFLCEAELCQECCLDDANVIFAALEKLSHSAK